APGHRGVCRACTEELARLQRSAVLVRDTVREMPSPDLKARTLAAIRAEGVVRPLPLAAAGATAAGTAGGPAAGPPPAPPPPGAARAPEPLRAPVSLARRRGLVPVLGWVATIAAAVVLSVVAASYLVG